MHVHVYIRTCTYTIPCTYGMCMACVGVQMLIMIVTGMYMYMCACSNQVCYLHVHVHVLTLHMSSRCNTRTCNFLCLKSIYMRQFIFLWKSDYCLGCAVLLCFVVCMALLAPFFLPSASIIKACTCTVCECSSTHSWRRLEMPALN